MLKAIRFHLCDVRQGELVHLAQRQTYRGIRQLQDHQGGFVVGEYLATDERADDHGTVYFFDESGASVPLDV